MTVSKLWIQSTTFCFNLFLGTIITFHSTGIRGWSICPKGSALMLKGCCCRMKKS